jgi:hypothetical protein
MAATTFEDIFVRLFNHNLNSSIYTSIPAGVVSVSTFEAEQTVDVKPLINKTYDDGVILALPNILAVPVVFPSAGGGALTFPISVGDTVLLVFSMRSMDEWLEGEGFSVTPVDLRTHYLNDAVAIPGLYTKKSHLKPNTTDVELKFKEQSIRLAASGDMVLSQANGKSLTLKPSGQVLHHSGAQITDDGDFITASGISLNNHPHAGSPSAPSGPVSNTGVPL